MEPAGRLPVLVFSASTANRHQIAATYVHPLMLLPRSLPAAQLHVEYPMLFKLENSKTGRTTHCGVLEFIADEGCAYLPHWMMQNLLLEVGDIIKLKNLSLPKGQTSAALYRVRFRRPAGVCACGSTHDFCTNCWNLKGRYNRVVCQGL